MLSLHEHVYLIARRVVEARLNNLKAAHIVAHFETNGVCGLVRTIYELGHWRNRWRELDPDGFEIM